MGNQNPWVIDGRAFVRRASQPLDWVEGRGQGIQVCTVGILGESVDQIHFDMLNRYLSEPFVPNLKPNTDLRELSIQVSFSFVFLRETAGDLSRPLLISLLFVFTVQIFPNYFLHREVM